MIRNYFKTAWRNLAKNKIFSLINIAGLSIGMAACLLILQYVSFELSYDQFNKNAADIYRVVNDRYHNGKLIQHSTITYSAISKAMKDDYPEVQNTTRVEPLPQAIIIYGDKIIFGVDLKLLRYMSVNVDKIIKKIKNTNVFLDDDRILIEYKKNVGKLEYQVKFIPYLYSITNEQNTTISFVHSLRKD